MKWVRLFLAIAALILIGGAGVHAAAFPKANAAIRASGLPDFYARSARALWLADSTTLAWIGVTCAFLAVRPHSATPLVIALTVLPVAATAGLIYWFLGSFPPAHLLAIATAFVMAAAIVRSRLSGE